MSEIEIISFPVAPLGCNCSIIKCKKTAKTIIIDPGGEGPKIISELIKHGCEVTNIIHTHAHFDHILGLDDLHVHCKSESGDENRIQTGLHRDDELLFTNLEAQCKMFGIPEARLNTKINHWIEDNEEIKFGDSSLKILHTPGHTPGSCSFYLENKEILFSGDTLFSRSIGRTDFPGGNSEQILKSIRNRLFTLDDNTSVIPGHGPSTRIYEEKNENPFF